MTVTTFRFLYTATFLLIAVLAVQKMVIQLDSLHLPLSMFSIENKFKHGVRPGCSTDCHSNTPGFRRCDSFSFFACWSVLTEPARTLNQYMYLNIARTTENERIDSCATFLYHLLCSRKKRSFYSDSYYI